MTAASWEGGISNGSATGPIRRAVGAVLLLVLVTGSFALWVGVPALVLWAIGAVTNDPAEHLVLGLIAVPLGMIVFGLLLAVLNTAYLRLAGVRLGTEEDEGEWRPRLRGPLDRIIGVSAAICLAAFLIWLLFGSADVGPAGPW